MLNYASNSSYMRYTFLLLCSFWALASLAQRPVSLQGVVVNKQNQQPLAGISIVINPGGNTAITDAAGKFTVTGLKAGAVNVAASGVGFNAVVLYNVAVSSGNISTVQIELEPSVASIEGVTVKGSRRTAKAASLETPLSVQRLTTEEIKANPGGNFDISRVIQSLPGVGGGVGGGGFRNDIIIRGGAPNENVFYLDGIEIPTINHFATQGAGGGPQGILNVSFIEDVKLSSSAFDARVDNALSSVFDFKQKKGNSERVQGNVRLSATELAGTFEGPLAKGKRPTTFLASARRSYLQLLFSALDLPIRPSYWDFQFKTTTQLSAKTTLTTLGVGAIDRFSFAVPQESTPEKTFALNSNPAIQQNSYTVGFALKHLIDNGFWNLAVSRNVLDNRLDRFSDNLNPTDASRNLGIKSVEAENKLRFDVNQTVNGFKIAYGVSAQWVQFTNNAFARISFQPDVTSTFNTSINFARLGAFVQVGKRFMNNRLGVSGGLRTDVNTFTTNGMNAAQTLSPRLSFNYVLADKWSFNASVGRYARLAPYTLLGYKDNAGNFSNKNADYTISNHYVAGFEYLPSSTTRFTLEGFYKQYNNVPISVRDGISLANLGNNFNVLGNEPVRTNGKGRAYGLEFFAQQKLTKRFFGILSYTLYVSEYTNANGRFAPSAWDNRHLLALTWGYKFPKNWELGLKFRFQGGAPYTDFDMAASQANFLTLGQGVLDFNRINQLRLNGFNSSDVRIDKKWYFKKATFDLFLDVTNWYQAQTFAPPSYTFRRNADNTAFLTTNGQPIQQNGSNGIPFLLSNNEINVLPTIGFIVEF